ncbi:TrbI/VirB10 family protein [Methylophilus sp. QUAN]|uniref:TrbI/VirB10 family protein n=1 Tax=Methylophilus sp. QUAN TaxID=2781020 RepID=UPI00188EEF14|nr:TrbI/VirB10 family protein [Methylophilus sp. QUAN]MBF4990983.1 TrbI/VirB10 family protein [Methylophilus sp. QUAN]
MAELKEITIDETKGKVKRNLQYWVIGTFALVAAVFFTIEGSKDPKKEVKEEAPKIDTEVKVDQGPLKEMLKEQENGAEKIADAQNDQSAGYAIPSVATEGVKTGQAPAEPTLTPEQDAQRRKEQAEFSQSKLLAIDATSNTNISDIEAQVRANSPQKFAEDAIQKSREDDANLEKAIMQQSERALAADQPIPMQPSPLMPATAVALDRQWADQQQKQVKVEKVLEDGRNAEYTIFQGSIIPAVILSKINSDLPGDIIAQTTQDVYDGVKGNHLIIPKGSKIYGVYNNDINTGQGKIMVAFQRIVLPGGRSISLPGMPGMDSIGQSGIAGDVDNHFLRLYGGSALVAAVGAVVDSYSRNNMNVASEDGQTTPGYGQQVTSASGRVLVDISRNILQRNNSIRPTITVNQGEKFNILVKKDIEVSPYKASK